MTSTEKQRLLRTISLLEARVAKLESLLLRGGRKIGETEHGDAVYAIANEPVGPSRMAEAMLGRG